MIINIKFKHINLLQISLVKATQLMNLHFHPLNLILQTNNKLLIPSQFNRITQALLTSLMQP
jgi:hypothetical protein